MNPTENDPWGVNGSSATTGAAPNTAASQTDGAAPTADATQSATNDQNSAATQKTVVVQPAAASKKSGAASGSDDFGTASMIFGIISLFLGGNVWGVIGLVLGCISANRRKNDHATVGIICSAISLVFWIITLIAVVVIFTVAWPEIKDAFSELTY